MHLSSTGRAIISLVVVMPALCISLNGCGVGSALSAAASIKQNGVGFDETLIPVHSNKQIQISTIPVNLSGASNSAGSAIGTSTGTPTGNTTGTSTGAPADSSDAESSKSGSASGSAGSSIPAAPQDVISPSSEQKMLSLLGSNHIKDLDATIAVTSSTPDTQVGIVLSTTPLTQDQTWSAANGVTFKAADGTATTLGGVFTIHQPGKYVLGPSGTSASDLAGYAYVGSLLTLTTSSGGEITLNHFDAASFASQFEQMIRSGQPIYVYASGSDPSNQPVKLTIDDMEIVGHAGVSF